MESWKKFNFCVRVNGKLKRIFSITNRGSTITISTELAEFSHGLSKAGSHQTFKKQGIHTVRNTISFHRSPNSPTHNILGARSIASDGSIDFEIDGVTKALKAKGENYAHLVSRIVPNLDNPRYDFSKKNFICICDLKTYFYTLIYHIYVSKIGVVPKFIDPYGPLSHARLRVDEFDFHLFFCLAEIPSTEKGIVSYFPAVNKYQEIISGEEYQKLLSSRALKDEFTSRGTPENSLEILLENILDESMLHSKIKSDTTQFIEAMVLEHSRNGLNFELGKVMIYGMGR